MDETRNWKNIVLLNGNLWRKKVIILLKFQRRGGGKMFYFFNFESHSRKLNLTIKYHFFGILKFINLLFSWKFGNLYFREFENSTIYIFRNLKFRQFKNSFLYISVINIFVNFIFFREIEISAIYIFRDFSVSVIIFFKNSSKLFWQIRDFENLAKLFSKSESAISIP